MFREAVEEYLEAVTLSGLSPDETAALKEAFARSGIRGYLQKRIDQLKAGSQTELDPTWLARAYARLGETEQAFYWLEKAYAERSDGLLRLKEELSFDSLRSDPRYADFLRRVGLPQ